MNEDGGGTEFLQLRRAPGEYLAGTWQTIYGGIHEGEKAYQTALRELREEIARRNYPRVSMETFSIGMSHDFEVAIEEGSTCVRIGSAIFGQRTKK